MSKVISFQEHLRPALPEVRGCKDYRDEQELLERIDRVLRVSGVEDAFLRESAEMFEARSAKQAAAGRAAKNGERARQAHAEHSRRALRCTILLRLCAGSFRKTSRGLAMSPLYRWFVGLPELGGIRVPGKSTLQRYGQWLPLERMEKVLGELLAAASDEQRAGCMGLEREMDTSCVWVDVTCLKACIHFPTDWVLLRDAVRTVVKCILTIRRHGLRHRMGAPEQFLGTVNALSMRMAAAGRRGHERIIGGRKIANKEKMLSLYEEDVHVIVRGKAGAEVEFGNGLFLGESPEGFIVDHELRQEMPPDDGRWLRQRLPGLKAKCGCNAWELTACADRGFDSALTTDCLKQEKVVNAVCPRNAAEMARRCAEEPGFKDLLRRRGGTEARIAIVKKVFLDGVPRAKGFERRQVQVSWAVLTHNLWVVARLALAAKEKLLAA